MPKGSETAYLQVVEVEPGASSALLKPGEDIGGKLGGNTAVKPQPSGNAVYGAQVGYARKLCPPAQLRAARN